MASHIVWDRAIIGGKPCIRRTRISAEFLLELVASGATRQEILDAYPHLTLEGIQAAMLYASRFLRSESVFEVEIPRGG